MTNAIVKEKKISFKTLEKKIFEEACKLAREHTKIILENGSLTLTHNTKFK